MKSVIQWYKCIAVSLKVASAILVCATVFACSVSLGQVGGVPAIPQDGGVYYDYSTPVQPTPNTALTTNQQSGALAVPITEPEVPIAPEPVVNQSMPDNSSGYAINTSGPFEKHGDYYVRTTDRYGNPKADLDQESEGILPQPIGAMPNSGPEVIDTRTLQPSGFKGAPGDTALNSTGCQLCGGGCGNPKLWAIEAGVKILHREAPEAIHSLHGILGQTSQLKTVSEIAVLKDNSFDIAFGLTLTANRYLGRDARNNNYFLEVGYWGLNEWDMTNSYMAIGTKDVITEEGETETIDTYEMLGYHIVSKINTVELNLKVAPRGKLHDRMVYLPNGRVRRECHQGWSTNMLVGLRYFKQNDTGTIANITNDTYFECETDNNMVGFQIGGELIDRHCIWNWGVNWKVAPLYNWSDRVFRNAGYELKQTEGQLSGFADIGFWANYKFSKHWTGRFQYNIMWVTGIAQATTQLAQGYNANVYAIDNDTTEFLQGLTLSMEYAW